MSHPTNAAAQRPGAATAAKARTIGVFTAFAAALMLTTALAVVAPSAAPAAAAPPATIAHTSNPTSCTRDEIGGATPVSKAATSSKKRPVVFVHGWTGKPLTALASSVNADLGGAITAMVYDYSKWASYWASNDHIAACLADYLHAVSDAYRKGGGDGRILVVGHSMGGIAIRYAMDPTKVSHPVTAAQVPGVVTVDTPHLGSPWGGLGAAQAKELWDRVWGNGIPNPFGVDGGRCLSLHQGDQQLPASCNGLPPWMAPGTTLYEIGSTVTVHRTFLGVHLYDVPLSSDGVVDYRSQTGYLTSGPGRAPAVSSATTGTVVHSQQIDCTVSTGQMSASLNAIGATLSSIGIPVSLVGDWRAMNALQTDLHTPEVLALDAAAFLTAPCAHSATLTFPATVDQVATDLHALLSSQAGITKASQVFNGAIPPSCQHPAGTLKGSVKNWGADRGGSSLDLKHAVFGDLTGDGVSEAAVPMDCNAGGVGWPQLLLIYGTGPKLLGYYDLNTITDPQEHAEVTEMTYGHGKVTVAFDTYDGANSSRATYTGTLSYTGGKAALSYAGPLTLDYESGRDGTYVTLGPGIVKSRADANLWLSPAPADFKAFIAQQWATLAPVASHCGLSAVVSVARYTHLGYAYGGVNSCGGAEVFWAKTAAGWQTIFGTQEAIYCRKVSGNATLKKALAALGLPCYTDSDQPVRPPRPWPASGR